MGNISEELRKEGEQRAIIKCIRSMMETLKLTAEQAMAALEIPEEDRKKYSAML